MVNNWYTNNGLLYCFVQLQWFLSDNGVSFIMVYIIFAYLAISLDLYFSNSKFQKVMLVLTNGCYMLCYDI